MRRLLFLAAVTAGFAMPAAAQNTANNNGIWWGGPAGGRGAFSLLNPLTTLYGRLGATHAWQPTVGYNYDYYFGPPYSIAIGDGFGFVAGVGARLMPAVRYELQVSGTLNAPAILRVVGNPIPSVQRYSSFQLMNNFYVDLAPIVGGMGSFNLYVMGGVGVSINRATDYVNVPGDALPGTGVTRARFAWNFGGGAQVQVLNNLLIDAGYRYLDLGRFYNAAATSTVDGRSDAVRAHQVMFSLVVPFDGLAAGW